MRNVGVFAHVDAGKTTTTEHMLFKSGTIRSLGSVDDGTAQTDNLDIERQRGISVRAATTSIIWRDIYINLIDTPGHVDFLSEVERSIRVMDGAVLIVSAAEGVQSQTETIWHALRSLSIPTIIYVNKMDRVGVSVPDVLEQIRRLLSPSAVPLQVPQGAGEDFRGILPIWNTLQDDQNNELDLSTVITSVADHDDELMLRYIEGEQIPMEELQNRFQSLTKSGHLFPLYFGSSQRDIGVAELMDAITTYLPSPMGDVEAPLSGIIFKIERDKAMGRTAYVRLFNGSLRNRELIHNVTKDIHEKITQIRKLEGRKFVDLGQVFSGDIAAVYGLSQSKIGDVLGSTVGVPLSRNRYSFTYRTSTYPR